MDCAERFLVCSLWQPAAQLRDVCASIWSAQHDGNIPGELNDSSLGAHGSSTLNRTAPQRLDLGLAHGNARLLASKTRGGSPFMSMQFPASGSSAANTLPGACRVGFALMA